MNWVSLDELQPWAIPPARTADPETQAEQREAEWHLKQLLNRLPPDYRIAVVLRYWYDLSYAEIAEMTSSTISAIKSRLHRARLMLAEDLLPAGKRKTEFRQLTAQDPGLIRV